jgi:hypothetical protein
LNSEVKRENFENSLIRSWTIFPSQGRKIQLTSESLYVIFVLFLNRERLFHVKILYNGKEKSLYSSVLMNVVDEGMPYNLEVLASI